ncbi:sarcoplasmic calcium-binding protein [Lingula anatina]|uniref:Sarcoplasmic calcium-binding protein n=1 Tax=Lingula anatina TaxID=7574 RepID=A0A1S3JCC3_LINAN|nr:sarcoplasmic calcium-binding protein [Lingula anatina]|eukprot:XP_013407534.1 sarcoplasmic calcium-binding protein [Lingula anatina]
MSGVSRRLPNVIRACRGLVRAMPVKRALWKDVQHGLDPKFSPLSLPVRGVKHRAIQFKKAPLDYPPVTGSDHWRRKLRTTFRCFDTNGDGYVSKEDFVISAKRCAQYLGLNDERTQCVLNQRTRIWGIIPKGADASKISEDDYVNGGLTVFNQHSFRQEFLPMVITEDFNAMDIDGDGIISHEEHKAFFYSLNIPVEMSKKIFDVMDIDKDGLITIDEFAHAMTEFLLTEDQDNAYSGFFGPLAD